MKIIKQILILTSAMLTLNVMANNFKCSRGQHYDKESSSCISNCTYGEIWVQKLNKCIREPNLYDCPKGEIYNDQNQKCEAIAACPKGEHWNGLSCRITH